VHIFRQEKREYYDIDQLFSELTESIKEEKDL
jgi:ribosomal silencing factor RsfS